MMCMVLRYERLMREYFSHSSNAKKKLIEEFVYYVQDERVELSELIIAKQEFMKTMYIQSKKKNTRYEYSRELNRFVAFCCERGEENVFPSHLASNIVEMKREEPEPVKKEYKNIEEEILESDGEYKAFLERYKKIEEEQ